MKIDPAVFSELIGYGGIGLGATLSAFGYIFRIRDERKRNIRKLLYHLLEFRHKIKMQAFDVDLLIHEYIEKISREIGVEKAVLMSVPDYAKMREMLIQCFRDSCFDIDQQFIDSYLDSVKKAAEIYPLLAFRLKGKEETPTLIKRASDAIEVYLSNLQSDTSDQESVFLKSWMAQQINNLHKDVLERVEDDIFLVAKYCGWRYRSKVKFAFNASDKNLAAERRRIMDRIVKEVVQSIKNRAQDVTREIS